MDSKITKKRFSKTKSNDIPIEKKTKLDKELREVVLPDEIWLRIMCHLNTKDLLITFGLVCKRFRCLSLDSKVFKVMVKYLELKNINDEVKFRGAMAVIKKAENLTGIRIESSREYWKQLMILALKKSSMKSLELLNNWCQFSKKSWFTLKDLKNMVEYGKQLEAITIRNTRIEPEDFKQIAYIKTLKSLQITDTNVYTKKKCIDVHCSIFTPENIIAIAKNCQYLEAINIFSKRMYYPSLDEYNDWSSSFDIFFNERKLTLKSLGLDGFFSLAHTSFLQNISICENLEELTLRNCTLAKLCQESLLHILGLKKLVISNTYSNFIYNMHFHNLKYLIIADTFSRKEDFEKLSKLLFPVLERVYINIPEYSDQCAKDFLKNSPMLKSAQLYLKERTFKIKPQTIISMIDLMDTAVKENIYLDFGSTINSSLKAVLLQQGISESQSAMIDKYYGLKNDFDQWCKNNNWWMNSWSQSK